MDRDGLIAALAGALPQPLAGDLVDEFLDIRVDVATATLGKATPGHFVESVVQALQHIEKGSHDPKPNVDEYLKTLETRAPALDDGLRICLARLGRAMYSLRNKRTIAHKGGSPPAMSDLRLLFAGAQWALCELLRQIGGMATDEADRLIAQVEAPVGGLIEDFGTSRLVLANTSAREEVLLLLHSHYPKPVAMKQLLVSTNRLSETTTRKATRALWQERMVEGDTKSGFKLTSKGFTEAIGVARRHLNSDGAVGTKNRNS